MSALHLAQVSRWVGVALLLLALHVAQGQQIIGKGEDDCLLAVPSIYSGHRGTLTDGSEEAHPYGGNRNCKIIIETGTSGPVRLKFLRFDTEHFHDRLLVFDGPDADKDNQIARLSGASLPETIVTPLRNQTRILLWWITDGTNSGGLHHFGWALQWAAPTCRSVQPDLSVPWGRLSHGGLGYDHVYGPNCNCSWHLDFSKEEDPPEGVAKARFWISRLDLSLGDKLLIYSGKSIYSELAGEVSGENLIAGTENGQLIEVFSDKVMILFQTDNEGPERSGFDISWPAPWCNSVMALPGVAGTFTDGSPEEMVYTPGGKNHVCNWNLNTLPDKPFVMSFHYFGLWGPSDVLRLYTGHANSNLISSNGRELFKVVTGDELPEAMKLSSTPQGKYSIELVMDHSDVSLPQPWTGDKRYVGFKGSWASAYCFGLNEITSPGLLSITDGSPASEYYEPSTNCSWLVKPKFGGPLRLFFDRFQVHRFHDFLWVYKGEDASAPLIAEMSGDDFNHSSAFPLNYTVLGDDAALFFQFQTGDELGPSNIPQYGFQFTWSAPYCSKIPQIHTEPQGTVTDGSRDKSYIAGSHCVWVIQPGYSGIRIMLRQMQTRKGLDTIRIYGSSGVNQDALIAEWSGKHEISNNCLEGSAYSADTQGGVLTVEFIVADDGTVQGTSATVDETMRGWEMEWLPAPQCTVGPVVLTEPSGVLTDGSPWESPYGAYSNCTWVIKPALGIGPITVELKAMATGTYNDFLYVHGGDQAADSSLLKSFSGTYTTQTHSAEARTVVSQTGGWEFDSVTLRFISGCREDSSNVKGWRLTWSRYVPIPPSPPSPRPPPPSPSPPPPPLPPILPDQPPTPPLPPPPPYSPPPSPLPPSTLPPFNPTPPPQPQPPMPEAAVAAVPSEPLEAPADNEDEAPSPMSTNTAILIACIGAATGLVSACLVYGGLRVGRAFCKRSVKADPPGYIHLHVNSPATSRHSRHSRHNLLVISDVEETSQDSQSPSSGQPLVGDLVQWTPPGTPPSASPSGDIRKVVPIWDTALQGNTGPEPWPGAYSPACSRTGTPEGRVSSRRLTPTGGNGSTMAVHPLSVGGSRPGTSSSTLGGSRPGSRTGTPSGYAVNSRPTTPSGERNFGYQSPPPAPPGGGGNRKGMLSKSVLREIPSNPLRPPTPSGGQSRPHSPSTSPPRSPHTRNPSPLRQQPPRPATSQGLPPLGSEFSWVNENRPGTSSPPKGRTSDVQLTPLPISPPRASSMRQTSKVSGGWVIQ